MTRRGVEQMAKEQGYAEAKGVTQTMTPQGVEQMARLVRMRLPWG